MKNKLIICLALITIFSSGKVMAQLSNAADIMSGRAPKPTFDSNGCLNKGYVSDERMKVLDMNGDNCTTDEEMKTFVRLEAEAHMQQMSNK